jgi:RHS repeat-associated protein
MGRLTVWLIAALAIGFGGCSGCNNGGPPGFAAPPLNRTIATNLADETSFLYSGDHPVQTGVAPGTIQRLRVSVLRGIVRDRSNAPLAGVRVHELNHPEFGQTTTRADGQYDFAVNGGGTLTLVFEREGAPVVQRQVHPVWRDWVVLHDVVMTPYDGAVTAVEFSSMPNMVVARGSKVTDKDGTRRATLLFAAGTTAMMRMPDGSTKPLGTAHVRATEYTVGDNGPNAMPALLPANSAYTYAVDLSADEAKQAGAVSVEFNKPVALYVDDFINLPVGTLMPVGFYDAVRGTWVPSENGVVLRIVSITTGAADLDVTGDGMADDTTALGITADEKQHLAALYPVGATMWRAPLRHFSDPDCNLPFGPQGVSDPSILKEDANTDQPNDKDYQSGGHSILEVESQILGESIGIPGTPFSLNYRSDRVPGRLASYTVEIPITNNSVTPSLQRVDLEILIAGRKINKSFPPTVNQTYGFTWDQKDAYGNLVQGSQPITVRTGYVYKGGYSQPPMFGANGNGLTITSSMARQEATIWSVWSGRIGPWDARPLGFGGWSLSPHHAYDTDGHILYYGDGRRRSTRSLGRIIDTVAGLASQLPVDGMPAKPALVSVKHGVAVDAANNIYFSDSTDAIVRMIDGNGNLQRVAGTGAHGSDGDGGPAAQATLTYPDALAFDADGNLLIADTGANCVRKVDMTSGVISRFAGDGLAASGGDEGPAVAAHLMPFAIATSPDHSVYITETGSNGIRRVTSDQIIHSMPLNLPGPNDPEPTLPEGIAVNPVNGKLYVSDSGNHRIGAFLDDDVNIEIIAGKGTAGYSGDGGPALDALLNQPAGIAFAPDGTLYFAQPTDAVVRAIGTNGNIYTVAGYAMGDPGDGGPAESAKLVEPYALAVAPNGDLVIGDQFANRVRTVHPPLPSLSLNGIAVAEEDGLSVLLFDGNGRHLKTVSALTGAALYTFGYDGAGRLTSITDVDNQMTTITRDGSGLARQIKSSFGVTTTLGYDGNNYLQSIRNAANEAVTMVAGADGLLQSLTDPRGGLHTFKYDPLGRLHSDADPTGAATTLDRTDVAPGEFSVAVTSPLGRVERLGLGRIPGKNGQRHTMTDQAGFVITSDVGTDGTTVTTRPDGTITTARVGADPRFGMQVPIPLQQTLVLPSGRTLSTTARRTVTLMSPDDRLSLGTISDTLSVNGKSMTVVYDGPSRTSTVTTATGRQAMSTLDVAARPVRNQISGLADATYQYTADGMLAAVTQSNRTWMFTYDGSGFLATVQGPLSWTLQGKYDAAGRLTSLTLPGARSFVYGWDANTNFKTLKMPSGASYAFSYDARDLLGQTTEPAISTGATGQIWTFDPDQQLSSVKLADGAMLNMSYDGAGRAQSWSVDADSVGFVWDGASGRLAQITSAFGTLSFNYDGLLPVGWSWAGPVNGNIRFDFNNDLLLTGETVDGGATTSFTYDNDNLLTGAGPLTLQRDPANGRLEGTTVGAVADTIGYDGFGAVTTYQAASGGAALYAATFEYDALARITKQTETISGAAHTDEYAYDAAGRLASVKRDGVSAGSWSYDGNGNRTSGGAMYDAQDRLLMSAGASYGYDVRGRRTTKIDGAGKTLYRWDGLGRLAGVDLPTGTHVDYVLDPAGRVVGRKLNGTLAQGFIYRNALFPAAELDGSGAVVSLFVYASRLNVPDLVLRGGKIYRIWSDIRGSPRLVVDAGSGTVAEQLDYDVWGRLASAPSTLQPFSFAGGLYDPATGLVHFGARWYDPVEGVWLSKDPLGPMASDTGTYAYAGDDPINFFDPTGFWDWPTAKQSFLSGVADAQTGGFTTAFAQQVTIDGAVNPCPTADPGAFKAGRYAGYLATMIPGFTLTRTVANDAEMLITRGPLTGELARPYINSPLLANEIMQAAPGVPDPGGVPGALRWDVPGTFRGTEGTYELVYDPATNTILHFLFR